MNSALLEISPEVFIPDLTYLYVMLLTCLLEGTLYGVARRRKGIFPQA
jgi:hypothetical protein